MRDAAAGTKIGLQKLGSTGVIVGGPTKKGAYTWLKVNWDSGADGWSVQNYVQKIPSAPVAIAPTADARLSSVANALTALESVLDAIIQKLSL